MPELPDLQVFASNLKKILLGKTVNSVHVVNGKKLQDNEKTLTASLKGSKVKDVYRSGKELRFLFSNDQLLGLHLMLTGDIYYFKNVKEENKYKSTIVEIIFEKGDGLVLTDRMKNANVRLNPMNKKGIDAIDAKLNYAYLKKITDSNAQIKNILLNQDIIRGIGNSYSDEILWQCRISPFSIAKAIPDEKIKELVTTIKKVLKNEIKRINKNYPGLIHGEIKDFLQIHTKKTDKSPTGAIIKTAARGMLKTYYTEEQIVYK